MQIETRWGRHPNKTGCDSLNDRISGKLRSPFQTRRARSLDSRTLAHLREIRTPPLTKDAMRIITLFVRVMA